MHFGYLCPGVIVILPWFCHHLIKSGIPFWHPSLLACSPESRSDVRSLACFPCSLLATHEDNRDVPEPGSAAPSCQDTHSFRHTSHPRDFGRQGLSSSSEAEVLWPLSGCSRSCSPPKEFEQRGKCPPSEMRLQGRDLTSCCSGQRRGEKEPPPPQDAAGGIEGKEALLHSARRKWPLPPPKLLLQASLTQYCSNLGQFSSLPCTNSPHRGCFHRIPPPKDARAPLK